MNKVVFSYWFEEVESVLKSDYEIDDISLTQHYQLVARYKAGDTPQSAAKTVMSQPE